MRTLGLIAVTAVMATVAAPARAQVDCIIPRHDEAPNVPRSDPVLQAARKAEEIILERGDFIATLPEPIRLRSSLVIENRSPRSAHLQVQIITVGVGGGSNSAPQAIAANNAWVKRVMDNIDYEALSKLLN